MERRERKLGVRYCTIHKNENCTKQNLGDIRMSTNVKSFADSQRGASLSTIFLPCPVPVFP